MFDTYFKDQETQRLEIKRNQILQRPGGIASKAYYVKSGLLRSYLIDDKGKTHIFMFAPEGWIISDTQSYTLSTPTKLYIDALEDSEIIQINQISLDTFTTSNQHDAAIIQKLFRRIAFLQNRVILLMSATARQRYEHFMETYPLLTNRVPLKMIASYLGVTPEALSSIRSKMRRQTK